MTSQAPWLSRQSTISPTLSLSPPQSPSPNEAPTTSAPSARADSQDFSQSIPERLHSHTSTQLSQTGSATDDDDLDAPFQPSRMEVPNSQPSEESIHSDVEASTNVQRHRSDSSDTQIVPETQYDEHGQVVTVSGPGEESASIGDGELVAADADPDRGHEGVGDELGAEAEAEFGVDGAGVNGMNVEGEDGDETDADDAALEMKLTSVMLNGKPDRSSAYWQRKIDAVEAKMERNKDIRQRKVDKAERALRSARKELLEAEDDLESMPQRHKDERNAAKARLKVAKSELKESESEFETEVADRKKKNDKDGL
ncbi:unnamed protein product [Zymoseptoria tritici ST99CH_1A5]|uniref:Uncharacterized protein n=1 Tax=Zymoseptoria tritici ST99CH_1A5 TaxID=1276529 RepID=A0A1Y6LX07_ZYMTR|nr:unnamed protein product [Zymoseptoria tritici ST99CH_1A5]